jgi:hypothetical protein
MRLVYFDEGGELVLNWMWLPTFMGQNYHLLRELETAWTERFLGKDTTEDVLDEIHEFTVEWLAEKAPLPGVAEYLLAIEHVKDDFQETEDGREEELG